MPLPAALTALRASTSGLGLREIAKKAAGFTFGTTPKWMLKNPGYGIPLGYFGTQWAMKDIYDPLRKGMTRNKTQEMRDLGLMQLDMEMAAKEQQQEWKRLQSDISRNAATLAAVSPHLYNQILAGRTLPQGAVVLGGAPRVDLLEQLALGMASGKYNEEDSDTSLLAAMAMGQQYP